MKTIIRISIFAIMLLATFACNSDKQRTEIADIEVLYFNYEFESDVSVDCDSIKKEPRPSFERVYAYDSQDTNTEIYSFICYMAVIDTLITDRAVLDTIATELQKLTPDPENDNSIDARITATVRYRDGHTDKLCIDSNNLLLNGEAQLKNNKLIYLLKHHSGYYSWMDDSDLNYMDELKDTTFRRDSIVRNPLLKFIEE